MLTALFTVPTSTMSDLAAVLTDTFIDAGTWKLVILVIGLPLVFWGIKRIAGLFPKK